MAFFEINLAHVPLFKGLYTKTPKGGEPLISETPFLIRWTTNPNVTSVRYVQIAYTLDNGTTWKTIPTSADSSDDGSFQWTVPKVTKEKKNFKEKIILKNASDRTLASDMSDSVFTIRPAPLL